MIHKIKIYKIVNTINDEIYVGSTKSELRMRWYNHKNTAKTHPDRNGLYEMINTYGFDKFKIILITEKDCESKSNQLQIEQQYIDELKPALNKSNAFGSICEHNRIRSTCKLCGGGSVCEHDRKRSQCKLCGGSQICEHDRRRSSCKLCGGSQICEHDTRRSSCKLCTDFKCEICNKKFAGKRSLEGHYKSKKHLNNLEES